LLAEILDKVDKGTMKVDKGYKQIKNEQTRQEKIARLKHDTALSKLLPNNVDLRYGDFREKLKDIPDDSIDLIFTDPPYDEQSLPLYNDLIEVASRVLKPGASLLTLFGSWALPQIFEYAKNSDLKYQWRICVKHHGNSAKMWKQQVRVKWKPLVWLVRGDKPTYQVEMDDYIDSAPPDKILHEWQQSITEAEYMISHLTVEDQTILDHLWEAVLLVKQR
jgi:16S rRNA G966 N2-methylase RsmD